MKSSKAIFIFLIVASILVTGTSFSTKKGPTFSYQNFAKHYDLRGKGLDERLEGKLLLIEFWASWCAPCRTQNGHLLEVYEKYKDSSSTYGDGLEIISVALDSDSVRWRKAIKNDRIEEFVHLRDSAKWESEFIRPSGIHYLPNNVLISSGGYWVGQEMYGENLIQMLDESIAKAKE